MRPKLRLGLIGTGIAARELYLPAWKRLEPRIELVACTNRRREKAEAYARLAGIPKVVDSGEALIALPEVDAVVISLPIDVQPRYVLSALAAGKPVLSEKPVAPSIDAGQKLLKRAARHDAAWLVGENFAFMPHVRRLREWLAGGKLGELRFIQAVQATRMDAKNHYFHTPWRHAGGFDGGFIADGGVHLAHVLRSCFGLPTRVQSELGHFDPSLPKPDTAVATLRFANGMVGTWTSCFSAHHRGPMLRLFGSKANAELSHTEVSLETANGKRSTHRAEHDSFFAEFLHFADVVQRGARPLVPPEEALDDLRLIDAILHARRAGSGATARSAPRTTSRTKRSEPRARAR
jgi:predicted dehydrogenase